MLQNTSMMIIIIHVTLLRQMKISSHFQAVGLTFVNARKSVSQDNNIVYPPGHIGHCADYCTAVVLVESIILFLWP